MTDIYRIAGMIGKTVLWGALYCGLGAFVVVGLLDFFTGYFLWGLLVGLYAGIFALRVSIIVGLVTGIILGILSYFFPTPSQNEKLYKFMMGLAAVISSAVLAYFSWMTVLYEITTTGSISQGFLLSLTAITTTIFAYISQKLAKEQLEQIENKTKLGI